jgi:hypothetical protein
MIGVLPETSAPAKRANVCYACLFERPEYRFPCDHAVCRDCAVDFDETDGGGVRGIIQLTLLKKLEDLIGLDLPLGQFFDMIVGTSAGK